MTSCMVCFADGSENITILLNAEKHSAIINRHKEFKREAEEFDYYLDWVYISKSIAQLNEIVKILAEESPILNEDHISIWHSIIADENKIRDLTIEKKGDMKFGQNCKPNIGRSLMDKSRDI